MKKPLPQKKQAIKRLQVCIREGRKLARQVNRKLESLKQWNNAKDYAKQELIRLFEMNAKGK
jgi:hypothetical protein